MNILDAVNSKTRVKKISTTKGGEYAGACPGCGGKDRFRVWPDDKGGEGSFWCRGCGKGGDYVQFLVEFCGMEYPAAFREAGRERPAGYQSARYRAVGEGNNGSNAQVFTPRHFDPPVETWQIKAEALVSESHENLLNNDKVLGWLDRRGLDLDAVKAFRLGWFPGERGNPCKYRPRLSWGLPEILKDNGKAKKLWIPRGVVIPWIQDNQIQRIKIRRPGADLKKEWDVKYYFMPGSSAEPALLNPDRQAFVIVESEFDGLLVARRAGTIAGCLILGSAANKPGAEAHARLGKSIRILDALDSDVAGVKAGKWWQEEYPQTKRWPVPVGKDPGEAFANGVDILSWITAGLPPALTITVKKHVSDNVEVPEQPPVDINQDVLPVNDPPMSAAIPHDHQPPPVLEEPAPGNPGFEGPVNGTHDIEDSANENPGIEYPEGLSELKKLLIKYPVKIISTRMRTAVVHAPDWHNEDVEKRISALVFTDFDVFEYLETHPAKTIHRGNFDQGVLA